MMLEKLTRAALFTLDVNGRLRGSLLTHLLASDIAQAWFHFFEML
jgi:hypothetical protein